MDTQDGAGRTTSPDDILIGSWVDLQFNCSESPSSSLLRGQEQISLSSDESDIEIMLLDAQHESGRSSSKSSQCSSPLEPETLFLTSSSSEGNTSQAGQDFRGRRRKVKKMRKTNSDSSCLAELIPLNSLLKPETFLLMSSGSDGNISQSDQDSHEIGQEVDNLMEINSDSSSLSVISPPDSPLRLETPDLTSSSSDENIPQSEEDFQRRRQTLKKDWMEDLLSRSESNPPNSPVTPIPKSNGSEGNISQSDQDFRKRRQDIDNLMETNCLSLLENTPPNSPLRPETTLVTSSSPEVNVSKSEQDSGERRQEFDNLVKTNSACSSPSENIVLSYDVVYGGEASAGPAMFSGSLFSHMTGSLQTDLVFPEKSSLQRPETPSQTYRCTEGNISQLDQYLQERRKEVDNLIKTISDCSSEPEISPPNSPQLRPEPSLHTSSSSEGNISPSGQDSKERRQEVDSKLKIADWRSRPENSPPKDFLLKHPKRSTFLSIKETSVLGGGIPSSGYPKYFVPSLIFSHVVAFGIGIYFGKRIASHNSI